MQELSLHILDIAKNSVIADAKKIEIRITEDIEEDIFLIEINDDGKGMNKEFLQNVTNPFTTSRTTRRVGLGIPLFKAAAEQTGGYFKIESEPGKGTRLAACFGHSSVDRAPLGDIAGSVVTLINGSPGIVFSFTHTVNKNSFNFDTEQIKEILGPIDISSPEITLWINEFLTENIKELY